MSVNPDVKNYADNQAAWLSVMRGLVENVDANLTNLSEKFDSMLDREYGYIPSGEEIVADGLEKDYQTIIANEPALGEVSAVGMLAILSDFENRYEVVSEEPTDWEVNYMSYYVTDNGEYVRNNNSTWDSEKTYYSHKADMVKRQGNRMFINGTEIFHDYGFEGRNSVDGIEIVKIWYFENEGNRLTLQKLQINIIKTILKAISLPPLLSNDFYDYIDEIEYNNLPPVAPKLVRKQKNTLGGRWTDRICNTIVEYETNCVTFPVSNLFANARSTIEKFIAPFLETIEFAGNSDSFLRSCKGLKEIYFPNLKMIGGGNYNGASPFHDVPTVVVPESVDSMGKYSFSNNNNIVLNCKNATTIHDNWCCSTPTQSFTMCSDWGASINIAIAAANWLMTGFIDLMNNKLRDMTLTNETRTLTIPATMLTTLQNDTDGAAALEAAATKGWTVTSS